MGRTPYVPQTTGSHLALSEEYLNKLNPALLLRKRYLTGTSPDFETTKGYVAQAVSPDVQRELWGNQFLAGQRNLQNIVSIGEQSVDVQKEELKRMQQARRLAYWLRVINIVKKVIATAAGGVAGYQLASQTEKGAEGLQASAMTTNTTGVGSGGTGDGQSPFQGLERQPSYGEMYGRKSSTDPRTFGGTASSAAVSTSGVSYNALGGANAWTYSGQSAMGGSGARFKT